MHPPAEQLVRNHDVEQEDEHSGIHSEEIRVAQPLTHAVRVQVGKSRTDQRVIYRMITEDERRKEGFCVQIVLCALLRWTSACPAW